MTDEVKWVSDCRVVINGWTFDFDDMTAWRNSWAISLVDHTAHHSDNSWKEGNHTRLDDHEKFGICSMRKGELGIEYGRFDYGKWCCFFTSPEECYNNLIVDAYANYLLERRLRF